MAKADAKLMKLAQTTKTITEPSGDTAEIRAANAYHLRAPHSSVHDAGAKTKSDPIEARISDHDELPAHHPPNKRKDTDNILFYYKQSNMPALTGMLAYVLGTYTLHTRNKYCPDKYKAQMTKYMANYPLGVHKPDLSDTSYYDNATTILSLIHI